MALSKVQGSQIESPVDINAINITGVATFASAVVTGDLTVQGTTTTLDTTVENVDLLEVGANSAGAAVTVTQAGSGDFIHVGTAGSAFTVDNSGAIGIGTINPRSKLDIQGSNSELRFYRDAGDRFGGIRYTGNDWTFRLPTNDHFVLKTAGDSDELLRITATGAASFTSDGSDANGANINLIHENNNTTDVVSSLIFSNNVGEVARIQGETSGGNTNGLITFYTDNSGTSAERLRITNTGTAEFTSNLAVSGSELGSRTLRIQDSTTDNAMIYGDNSGGLSIQGGASQPGSGISLLGKSASTDPGTIKFFTTVADNNIASAERMRISSGGSVGIATDNPRLAKLHIGADTYALNVQNNGNNKSFILFSKNAAPNDARAWIEANGELSGGYLAFAAADGERFRINNNGVGIRTDDAKYAFQLTEDTLLLTSGHSSGTSVDIAYMHRVATSSISARMQFKNSARDGSSYTANEPGEIIFATRPSDNEASGQSGNLQNRLTIQSDGRLYIHAGNCNHSTADAALRIQGNYGDSTRSVIVLLETATQGRGKILTGNADSDPPTFSASSDRRMKTNIRPYTGGYEKIKSIPVKMFDLTVGTAKTDNVGWIADEVSPIFPDSVLGEPDAERVLGFCTDAQGNVTCTDVLESCACEGDTWTETHREPIYQDLAPLSWYPELVSAVQTLIAKVESLESAVGIAST